MALYRKKPVVIEAEQFTGNDFGYYDSNGVYINSKVGVDSLGIHHTIME
jgi:hypothetical protein